MIGDLPLRPLPPVRLAAEAATVAVGRDPAPAPVPPTGRSELPAEQAVQPVRSVLRAAGAEDHRPGGADGPDLIAVTLYQDAASKRYVAVIRDKGSGEIIEQIPPDDLLEAYAALRERFERIEIEIEV